MIISNHNHRDYGDSVIRTQMDPYSNYIAFGTLDQLSYDSQRKRFVILLISFREAYYSKIGI
jgi:hypothetical protein